MGGQGDDDRKRRAANVRLGWILGAVAVVLFLLSLWKLRL